jgi:hypothetical protein
MKSHNVTKSQGHKVILAIFLCLVMAGCAGVLEAGRGIAGTSTKILEESKPQAVSRVVAMDEAQVLQKIEEQVVPSLNAYVYARVPEKHLIAIYASENDTTPVGIYTVATADGGTMISVSSPSIYAKESILQAVYDVLTKKKPANEKPSAVTNTK